MFKCTQKISSGESTNIYKLPEMQRQWDIFPLLSHVWPRLIWSVLLTWGLSSVIPPGDSSVFCQRCDKDVTNRFFFFFFWSHFALEKFLQVQCFFSLFWMMFFQSQSRKEDWKQSRRNEDVSTAAVGRGENQGQWKTDKQKSSKGSAMVSRCTDSKG